MRRAFVVGLVLVGSAVAIAAGCAAFDADEAPGTASDGGPDAVTPAPAAIEIDAGRVDPADATAPVPQVDVTSGCSPPPPVPLPAQLVLCDDFEDGNLRPWEKPDEDDGQVGFDGEFVSPSRSARTETLAGTGSPDARLRTRTKSGGRLIVSGNLQIKSSDTTGSVQLVKLQVVAGTGVVLFRSDGRVVEIRKDPNKPDETNTSPDQVMVPKGRWAPFTVVLDFRMHTARVDVGGTAAALNLGRAKDPGDVDILLGPAEPSNPDKGWRVLWDNVSVVTEP